MSAAKTLIHSARGLVAGRLVDHSWVLFSNLSNRIEAVGVGDDWQALAADSGVSAESVIDAAGGLLSPGLIDTHVHGGGGFAAEGGRVAMQGLIDFHRTQGTTSLILSLVSNPIEQMKSLIAEAVAVAKDNPGLIGLHLEGPFLSHSHKGAHNPDALVLPTVSVLQDLLEVSEGLIKSITIAPELFDEDCVRVLVDAGVVICVGHTDADYAAAKVAFRDYARVLTHAFNGMRGIHHREPGPVTAALEADGAWLELIADGVHVAPSVARLISAQKLILVTDAMAAAGQPDGDYTLGALPVRVVDGIARTESGSIAGSTLTMPRAVKNYADWSGDVAAALTAATEHPAKAYGLTDRGEIAVGKRADLILWSSDLVPERIWSVGA